jgi:hypothetical protein
MIQASQIKDRMQIVGSDGQQLGSVERVDGSSRIKFAPKGMADDREIISFRSIGSLRWKGKRSG